MSSQEGKKREPTPIGDVLPATQVAKCKRCLTVDVDQVRVMYDLWVPVYCVGCERERDAEERVAEADRRETERRAVALASLDVPLLYVDATLDNFELLPRLYPNQTTADKVVARAEAIEKQGRVLQFARRYLGLWPERHDADKRFDFPHIAIFAGVPGAGKGHIAWSIARAVALEYGDPVKFTVLSDCIRDLRESWKQRPGEGPSEVQRLRAYRTPALLIIDEVSTHAFRGEPTQDLYDLVAWREQRLLPTIITTNDTKRDLADVLGTALVSRAAGWGRVWEFPEVDYRVSRRDRREGRAA